MKGMYHDNHDFDSLLMSMMVKLMLMMMMMIE